MDSSSSLSGTREFDDLISCLGVGDFGGGCEGGRRVKKWVGVAGGFVVGRLQLGGAQAGGGGSGTYLWPAGLFPDSGKRDATVHRTGSITHATHIHHSTLC
jgi:hypothetical protein